MDEKFGREICRNFGDRKSRHCRRCAEEFIPGTWNFYDLCHNCFALFDEQKMKGRWHNVLHRNEPMKDSYFESCEEWMKHFPYKNKSNQ